METKAKTYEMDLEIKIREHGTDNWGATKSEIYFRIKEKIPFGKEPTQYLRERLREEIKRHAATAKFNWEDSENPQEEI